MHTRISAVLNGHLLGIDCGILWKDHGKREPEDTGPKLGLAIWLEGIG